MDDSFLLDALLNKKVLGLGLDCIENEPIISTKMLNTLELHRNQTDL